jgi:hypothetical protein
VIRFPTSSGAARVAKCPEGDADVIVVSLDSSGAGALEAADLVQSGTATRVAVFTDPPSGEDHEFSAEGSLTMMRAQGRFAN